MFYFQTLISMADIYATMFFPFKRRILVKFLLSGCAIAFCRHSRRKMHDMTFIRGIDLLVSSAVPFIPLINCHCSSLYRLINVLLTDMVVNVYLDYRYPRLFLL